MLFPSFFPSQQIVYFLFLHDENTGFKGRKPLVERVGGLGERLWSLTVLTRGGLGAFTANALLWRRLVGLVVEFEEKRLGLDWVRSIGGRGRVRRTWDRRLMSTLCTGWWGKWYSYIKKKAKQSYLRIDIGPKSLIQKWSQSIKILGTNFRAILENVFCVNGSSTG